MCNNASDIFMEKLKKIFSSGYRPQSAKLVDNANHLLQHEFNTLGSGFVKVYYGMMCQGFEGNNYSDESVTYDSVLYKIPVTYKNICTKARALVSAFIPKYTPVDWHIDIKSGYRFPLKHHKEIGYGFCEGVDAKVASDLSRGYNLVTLAEAWKSTGEVKYRNEMMAQMMDWMSVNPFQYGPGWRANMNVAIRAVNWIGAVALIFSDSHSINSDEKEFLELFISSLKEHRRFIADNLEFPEDIYHPNHYIANLGGLLVTSAVCREFDEDASAWYTLALREIKNEIISQTGDQGYNFENATSYHAFVLEMLIIPLVITAKIDGCRTQAEVHEWIKAKIGLQSTLKIFDMFRVLKDILQDNGCIPLIGDTDAGRMLCMEDPDHDERCWSFLLPLGATLYDSPELLVNSIEHFDYTFAAAFFDNVPLTDRVRSSQPMAFNDSGMYVLRGAGIYSMISCGPIGTNGKGGHSHNDKLAFTLMVEGNDILIDPGVYVYTASHYLRELYRSTAMHNTAVVGDAEQNRFNDKSIWWGCMEDTKCRCIEWYTDNDVCFTGEHSGYLRLELPVIHRRKFLLKQDVKKLYVSDNFIYSNLEQGMLHTTINFNFHPECRFLMKSHTEFSVENGAARVTFKTGAGTFLESGTLISTSYGTKAAAKRISIVFVEGIGQNTVEISW